MTKTTKFSTNLFGSNAQRQLPWDMSDNDTGFWNSAYKSAPDAMRPIYSNGMWGWYAPRDADVPNSAYFLAVGGKEKRTTTKMTTDFILEQDLAMLTKETEIQGKLLYGLYFLRRTSVASVTSYNDTQRVWMDRIQVISLISLTLIQEPDSTKSLILSIGYNNPVVQTLEPLIANYTTLCSSTMPVPSANVK